MPYATPTTSPVLGKVRLVSLLDAEPLQVILPPNARWLIVWETSDATIPVYVLDTADAYPDQRRLVGALPMCIDIGDWTTLSLLASGGAPDVRFEVVKGYEERAPCPKK